MSGSTATSGRNSAAIPCSNAPPPSARNGTSRPSIRTTTPCPFRPSSPWSAASSPARRSNTAARAKRDHGSDDPAHQLRSARENYERKGHRHRDKTHQQIFAHRRDIETGERILKRHDQRQVEQVDAIAGPGEPLEQGRAKIEMLAEKHRQAEAEAEAGQRLPAGKEDREAPGAPGAEEGMA